MWILIFILFQLQTSDQSINIDYLNASFDKVKSTVQNFTSKQYNFRTGPTRWTIKENVEHLIKVEKTVQDLVRKFMSIKKSETFISNHSDNDVIRIIRARDQKFVAPKRLHSSNDYASLEEALNAFYQIRQSSITLFKEIAEESRHHHGEHPVLGDIDVFQWFLLASAHTERHLAQISEIIQDKTFPDNI